MAEKKKKPKKPPTPPQRKPWDVPPLAKGDKTKEEVYVAVGNALSKWGELESCLARIFGALAGSGPDSLPAERAYGSVLTFRGQKEMIEAAAEAFFFLAPNNSLHKKIRDLLKEALGFSARRNEIAHGIVTTRSIPCLSG